MDNFLSERGNISCEWEDFWSEKLSVCHANLYDPIRNVSGLINLASSNRSSSCDKPNSEKMNMAWQYHFDSARNGERSATNRLRTMIANFMNFILESSEPICPDNLFCSNGLESCIDLLAHCLADPEEVFLVPTPMCSRILPSFMQKSLVELYPIPIITEKEADCRLTIEKIIEAHRSALITGNIVRGIFISNPNKSLGDIYSPELLMQIMRFCKENCLHLIVDEGNAPHVFSKTKEFHSVLKFSEVADEDRTHVLYELRKEFGNSGIRVGIIHTKCKELQKRLMQLSYDQEISHPLAEILAHNLQDMAWHKKYIKSYKTELKMKYNVSAQYLKRNGIKIRECPSGKFIWVDLRHLCKSSFDGEKKLFSFLFQDAELFLAPGQELCCAEPGWFRIGFMQNSAYLKGALKYFKDSIEMYEP